MNKEKWEMKTNGHDGPAARQRPDGLPKRKYVSCVYDGTFLINLTQEEGQHRFSIAEPANRRPNAQERADAEERAISHYKNGEEKTLM
ncbi:hypothetical protein [Acetobacter senegalensis]|uniref:hypothetical protein n=1 Tax=Acetobacter senegalensis TaxID=446692 RepID=UPI00073EFF21|nr:hypothetical protein [Acetobacter senegalensis]